MRSQEDQFRVYNMFGSLINGNDEEVKSLMSTYYYDANKFALDLISQSRANCMRLRGENRNNFALIWSILMEKDFLEFLANNYDPDSRYNQTLIIHFLNAQGLFIDAAKVSMAYISKIKGSVIDRYYDRHNDFLCFDLNFENEKNCGQSGPLQKFWRGTDGKVVIANKETSTEFVKMICERSGLMANKFFVPKTTINLAYQNLANDTLPEFMDDCTTKAKSLSLFKRY